MNCPNVKSLNCGAFSTFILKENSELLFFGKQDTELTKKQKDPTRPWQIFNFNFFF